MERAMLMTEDQPLQIPMLPDDRQMLPDDQQLQISMLPEDDEQLQTSKSRLAEVDDDDGLPKDYEQLEKSLLPDEHRHQVLYTLEFTMLAILKMCPFPAPPVFTFQSYRDGDPIPVPRDWKPSLKLPQKMFDTQNLRTLRCQMLGLLRLITEAVSTYNSNAYLQCANTYLCKAMDYIIVARQKAANVKYKRGMAYLDRRTAKRLRAASIRQAEENMKAGAQQPKPTI